MLSGFARLTDEEKNEFIDALNNQLEKVSKGIKEAHDFRITLGPLKSGCPCCGR